ncbi:MAG: FAD-dependent oxidoreductase [Tropicimonas sp.]|uniref:FAD-dependent oxidoreductase n=1 Tax=Tropicimonas sp. TaxID=2067044 RepID=UPI003A846909
MYNVTYDYDVAVIGGGVAGLAAALLLGRAMIRSAVIADAQTWRSDKPTHNFLTNDGKPLDRIHHDGRQEVAGYDSVCFLDRSVTSLDHDGIGYNIAFEGGETLFVERLILADGNSLRPDALGIDGLAPLFGSRFFTCPYCHAHEFRGRRFGLLCSSATDADFARLLGHWAQDVTIFAHRAEPVPPETFAGRRLIEGEIASVEALDGDGPLRICAMDGTVEEVDVLFASDLPNNPAGGLAAGLGLDRMTHPITGKPIWKTDAAGRTQLGTCFVIGDARTGFSTLTGAANEGQIAGFMVVNDIIEARSAKTHTGADQPAI